MKYTFITITIALLAGLGWLGYTQSESLLITSEHEFEFMDTDTTTHDNLTVPLSFGDTISTTTTYLPPIPEPKSPDGRTRWASYWEPMTAEEYAVYGPKERQPGPPIVGIQVGHWQRENLPAELDGLTGSTGAIAGGYTEEEVNLVVAREVVAQLTRAGVQAQLLPVTVPIDFLADAFISIHADGSSNTAISGFKIAPPRADYSGKAQSLVDSLYTSYEAATSLKRDTAFTRRMSGYYAFNWRRYDHAVHPQTPSAIVEMGFLTNAEDRRLMTTESTRVATGIANGIIDYLISRDLLEQPNQ